VNVRNDRLPDPEQVIKAVTAAEVAVTPGGRPDPAALHTRRIRALNLRLAGLTYERIADELGYSTASAARDLILRALDAANHHQVEALRTLENERLDRAQAAIWPTIIGRPDEVGFDDRNKAVSTFIRISERRARLNGLDAPVQVAVTPGTAEIEAWVAEVLHVDDDAPDVVEADWTDESWTEPPWTDGTDEPVT